MWSYQKTLQYPVNIKNPNPALAKLIITQLGGPDGELGASLRYLSQRYAMPYKECIGILTDIGTEELGHMEMISAIVYQLTRNLTPEQLREGGFDAYFVDHTTGIYPVAASGVLVPPGTEEGGCQPCGLLSGDAVHFDLDPDGLLLHFGYLVFCSLAHVCDLRFGLFSLSVVTYYL